MKLISVMYVGLMQTQALKRPLVIEKERINF